VILVAIAEHDARRHVAEDRHLALAQLVEHDRARRHANIDGIGRSWLKLLKPPAATSTRSAV
jgi:hypothetical protein